MRIPVALAICIAPALLAHAVDKDTAVELRRAGAWSWEPGVVLPLLITMLCYLAGLWRYPVIPRKTQALFLAGWLTVALALVSPVHSMGNVLFSAHMLQHELLMVLGAPLLVLSRPGPVMIWGLPRWASRGAGSVIQGGNLHSLWHLCTTPLVAWLIHLFALWIWHAPVCFDAAVRNEAVHALQHATFLLSALIYWTSVFKSPRTGGVAFLSVFTTAVNTGILGGLLTLAPMPWYAAYYETTHHFGLSPLEDQQIGGLIMWVPAGIVYTVAGIALLARWIGSGEKRWTDVEA